MRFKALFAAIGAFLYDRVWLSKKSTILGILVYAAGEALIYFQGPNANPHTRLDRGLDRRAPSSRGRTRLSRTA
jgi:hypothetical protein